MPLHTLESRLVKQCSPTIDNAALLVEKSENFIPALQSLQDVTQALGLNISWQNTKIQNLRVGHQNPQCRLVASTMENVDEFICLGCQENSNIQSKLNIL